MDMRDVAEIEISKWVNEGYVVTNVDSWGEEDDSERTIMVNLSKKKCQCPNCK